MVEPAAVAGEDEDPPRGQRDRGVERELEVGRVLLGRVALDARPRRLRDRDGLGRRRVEVADRDVDLEAERQRVLETLVGGDDGRAERDRERAARGRAGLRLTPPPRSLPTRLPPLALPRSGSAGRRRVSPPSQPGLPELPVTSGAS